MTIYVEYCTHHLQYICQICSSSNFKKLVSVVTGVAIHLFVAWFIYMPSFTTGMEFLHNYYIARVYPSRQKWATWPYRGMSRSRISNLLKQLQHQEQHHERRHRQRLQKNWPRTQWWVWTLCQQYRTSMIKLILQFQALVESRGEWLQVLIPWRLTN